MLIVSFSLLHAQTIDEAIKNAAAGISEKLPQGSTVAVINFSSESARLTDYAIDELNGAIVNTGKLKPVERRQLNAVRDELNFNMSGEVSDESAQSIGRMLGTRNIVTGSIEIIGAVYRIRFQAVSVESASIQYAFSETIKNDSVLESLLVGTKSLVDFTTEERLGTAGLNLLFGAGSFFIEGDKFGGGVTAGLEAAGIALLVYSLAQFNTQHSAGNYSEEYDSIEKSYEAYPFFIGIGLYAGGAIFGVIRAFIYHKPGSLVAKTPFDGLDLNLVSAKNNTPGLQVAYTWRF
ncbi:MAG: CsgG/HfaB family protein [Treponema sp.]|nr:CsgG/HfaB family protein [Treponema sp.]